MKQRGIEVVNMQSKECQDLMEKFIQEKPEVWNEDIGEEERVHSKEPASTSKLKAPEFADNAGA